ncbi:MAG TPA: hypothetical protein VL284_16150 [Thermoanaerobaculia bacterium]|nr:hypothetical protein [Thermoanaerobaculia bacterium]
MNPVETILPRVLAGVGLMVILVTFGTIVDLAITFAHVLWLATAGHECGEPGSAASRPNEFVA